MDELNGNLIVVALAILALVAMVLGQLPKLRDFIREFLRPRGK